MFKGQYNRLQRDVPKFNDIINILNDTRVQNDRSVDQIVTHDGVFHCDEVMACALLKILPRFSTAGICRTRNESLLNQGLIVVDVGAKYDHATLRYDHHQNTFTETFNGVDGVKLSSIGLIYRHYGIDVISHLYPTLGDKYINEVYTKLYYNIIEEIDGFDNGIDSYTGECVYKIKTGLTSRVASVRPPANCDELTQNERFSEAMEIVIVEFLQKLHEIVENCTRDRQIIEAAIKGAENVHPCGEIIKLESYVVGWQEHVLELELQNNIRGKIKYCLVKKPDSWGIAAMTINTNDFKTRTTLEWKGLNDPELSVVSKIDGCIFVHSSGVFGGNKTFDGAVEMIIKSLGASKHME